MVPFYNNGATIALWAPNFSESGEVLSPPVPTPENLLDSLLRAGCKGSIAVPSFMVYWSKDMKAMESLRGLDCVVCITPLLHFRNTSLTPHPTDSSLVEPHSQTPLEMLSSLKA